MMINSGGDSGAVFSLLAALSDPEAAKSKLNGIVEATTIYEKMIEDFRVESSKTKEEISSAKADADSSLSQAIAVKTQADKDYEIRYKQLKDWEDVLSTRESNSSLTSQQQTAWDAKLRQREVDVTNREVDVTTREDAVSKLDASASSLKSSYEAKLNALQTAMNYTLPAETGSLGSSMNRID